MSPATFCRVTTAFGVNPSAVSPCARIEKRMLSESIWVLRSQPAGMGIRNFGSWSVRVGTSVIGAETDSHFSALGLVPEHPDTVTARAVTGTSSRTNGRRLCVRICIPSKPATAYRRTARPAPGSIAAADDVDTRAQIEQTSAPAAHAAAR